MDNIIAKVRNLIGDTLTTITDVFTYGSNRTFTLTEPNSVTIVDVYRNDEVSGVTHSFSTNTKKVNITSTLNSGDSIRIDYTAYQNYSDTELTSYIQAALVHLSINNYYNFEYDSATDEIYPTPETKEENLIAIVTSLLINPDNRTIRLPDLTINIPNDLPTDKKIASTIARYKKDSHGVFDILN